MMENVKMNYMSDLKNIQSIWLCGSCERSIDSMGHILWCPRTEVRKRFENDKDLAKYLLDVLIIRSRQENYCAVSPPCTG